MTNPHKGEVTFEAGGKTYAFKLGTHAQAAIEHKTKTSVYKFFSRADETWGVADLLTVFHAGLLRTHGLTESDVSDIMDELGIQRVGEIVGEALKLAFGEADKTAENPTPRKANRGIGMQQ